MQQLTGGEAVVKTLIKLGVDRIFALPGVQNDYLFTALHDHQEHIRVIHVRHEQGAAYMAMGYALATNKPSVYSVVPGPGLLNTTAALSTAYAVGAKVFCLTGQIPSANIGQGVGLLHELPDQLGILQRLTKWAERINAPGDVPASLTMAFSQMLSGRPRPVAVEIPPDVLSSRGDVDLSGVEPEVRMPAFDPQAIEQAAKLLGNARNPLIFVGGGAMDAGAEVQQLAEMLQAPIIPGRNGRGVVGNRHPLSLTAPAGQELWKSCDVAIGIGARMYRALARWGVDDDIKIIRVDVDESTMDTIVPTDVKVVGDSQAVLQALLDQLPKFNRSRPNRSEEIAEYREKMEEKYATLQPQYNFVKAIEAEFPEDGIMVDDVTQIGFVARFVLPIHHPRTYLSTGYQGTLGFGFPTALGVKVAFPSRPVINVSGDGGFMFNVQELSTAVRHNIQLVTLVFADGAFGNVRRMQKEDYDGRLIASDLYNPDFVKLAESFGVQGLRAKSPEELRGAIREGWAHNGPTLIEIPVGEMPSPWRISFGLRVRGKK